MNWLDSDWPGLVDAIRTAPDDDAPRLAAADWMEARGEFDCGEFIRLQCRWAETGRDFRSRIVGLSDTVPLLRGSCTWWELRQRRAIECAGSLPFEGNPHFGAILHRGFIAEIAVDLATWLAFGPAIVRLQPVEYLRIADRIAMDCGAGFKWARAEGPIQPERGQLGDEACIAELEVAIATLKAAVPDYLDPENSYDTVEAAEAGLSQRAIRWALGEPFDPGAIALIPEPETDPTACTIWSGGMLGRHAHLPNSPEKS